MASEYTVTRWGAIDRTAVPAAFIEYLDTVSALEVVQRLKRHTYDLMDAHEGHAILDLGCGLGDDARMLAERVGATGRVVGIDTSEIMIAEARRRSRGMDLPVEFFVTDVQRTALPDNAFDSCRADRLFVHVDNPAAALAEMIRVARPGGRLVVLDADWSTLVIDSTYRSVTRILLNFLCDSGNNRWIGRQLRRLCLAAGLKHIAVGADTLVISDYGLANQVFKLHETATQAQAAGVVSPADVQAWLDELGRAHETGTFFAAVTFFYVSGTKPSWAPRHHSRD